MNQQEQRSISDYQLERYLLRELPAADLAAVAREIAADPALGERLAALERSNQELHRRFSPEWMSGQIELKRQVSRQRESKQQRSGYRLWAVPAVALLLAVVAVPALFDASPEEEPQIRIKGGRWSPVNDLSQGVAWRRAFVRRGFGPQRGSGANNLPLRWPEIWGDTLGRRARCGDPAFARCGGKGCIPRGQRYARLCIRIR